ncbi:MAG: S24 family peptidase [Cyanobium sp. ELA712]
MPEALPSHAPRSGAAIDLQRLLIPDPARTVLLRVGGDSMVGAGIHHGDLVVVERHPTPATASWWWPGWLMASPSDA